METLPSYGGSSSGGGGSSGGSKSDPGGGSGGFGGSSEGGSSIYTPTPSSYSYAQTGSVVQNVLSSPVVCKGLATVVSISSLVNSFKYGKLAGIDEHVLQPLLDIYGTAEYIATKKTTSADKLQDKLDKRIENYKDSAGNVTLYNIGRISASVDMLAMSIAAIVLSGGSAAPAVGETALAGSGEILLAVSVSEAEIAAALVKATATIAAIGSAANLGSDIKEAEDSSADKKDDGTKESSSKRHLSNQELNQIKKEVVSGEDVHFDTKEQALEFIEKKYPDFQQEVAGNRSAEGWHFDSHALEQGSEAIDHINIYSKSQGFRVHIT